MIVESSPSQVDGEEKRNHLRQFSAAFASLDLSERNGPIAAMRTAIHLAKQKAKIAGADTVAAHNAKVQADVEKGLTEQQTKADKKAAKKKK